MNEQLKIKTIKPRILTVTGVERLPKGPPRKTQQAIDFYGELELIEINQVLNHWWSNGDPLDYMKSFFCRTLLMTGTRILEATRIEVKNCLPTMIHLTQTKGNKERDIEWFPEFQPFYDQYLERRRSQDGIWLFPSRYQLCDRNPTGAERAINRKTAFNWWEKMTLLARVRYLSPHPGGRKTALTWMAEILDPPDLQDQAGHAPGSKTTDQFYRGSIPGRRFNKPYPAWKEVAKEGVM